MATALTFEDFLGCQAALHGWVESYDTKDRDRLLKCIAPTLRIDYRAFDKGLWEAMPADAFVAMVFDPKFLGNPRIKTQHFVGASTWTKTNETEITGYHQMRVAHKKFADEQMTETAVKGHAHGKGTVWYRKVDGVWKFAGIEPDIRWSEYDLDKIFQEGDEKVEGTGS